MDISRPKFQFSVLGNAWHDPKVTFSSLKSNNFNQFSVTAINVGCIDFSVSTSSTANGCLVLFVAPDFNMASLQSVSGQYVFAWKPYCPILSATVMAMYVASYII